jgi:hypothetical protein
VKRSAEFRQGVVLVQIDDSSLSACLLVVPILGDAGMPLVEVIRRDVVAVVGLVRDPVSTYVTEAQAVLTLTPEQRFDACRPMELSLIDRVEKGQVPRPVRPLRSRRGLTAEQEFATPDRPVETASRNFDEKGAPLACIDHSYRRAVAPSCEPGAV